MCLQMTLFPYGGFKVGIYENQNKDAIRFTGIYKFKIVDSFDVYN